MDSNHLWKKVFTPSMLDDMDYYIFVHCPSRRSARKLFRELRARSFCWNSGKKVSWFKTMWSVHGPRTFYRIRPDKKITYGTIERSGFVEWYESQFSTISSMVFK